MQLLHYAEAPVLLDPWRAYQQEALSSYANRMGFDWYYTWDVASGCIWNAQAIASVTVLSGVPDGAAS